MGKGKDDLCVGLLMNIFKLFEVIFLQVGYGEVFGFGCLKVIVCISINEDGVFKSINI